MTDEQSVEEIVARFQSGDSNAFEDFLALYRPLIRTLLVRQGINTSDLNEVYQDVLVKLLQSKNSPYTLNSDNGLTNWIRVVAQNSARNHLRGLPKLEAAEEEARAKEFQTAIKNLTINNTLADLLSDEQSVDTQESLPVYIDPGEAPQELLTEFYVALATAYRAFGGSGLTISNEGRRSFAMELRK